MQAQPEPYISPQEYLSLERQAETKSEYWNGQTYAMSGASEAHNIIVFNLATTLGPQIKKRPCKAYASDMRVKVDPTGLYTYPDVSVVCGQAKFDEKRKDNLLNPTVIIEVLSPSTEAYDRGKKFDHYRRLESLQDYLLVAQDSVMVLHYARQTGDDDRWMLTAYYGLDTVVNIKSIGCELPLAEVYDKVEGLIQGLSTTLSVLKEEEAVYETGETSDP